MSGVAEGRVHFDFSPGLRSADASFGTATQRRLDLSSRSRTPSPSSPTARSVSFAFLPAAPTPLTLAIPISCTLRLVYRLSPPPSRLPPNLPTVLVHSDHLPLRIILLLPCPATVPQPDLLNLVPENTIRIHHTNLPFPPLQLFQVLLCTILILPTIPNPRP